MYFKFLIDINFHVPISEAAALSVAVLLFDQTVDTVTF